MVSLEDVEEAIRGHPDPVVSTTDLASEDRLDCSARHVLDQLRLLERAGAVESKDIGARAVAWWHVDRVRPPIESPEDHPDQEPLEHYEPARGAAGGGGRDDHVGAPVDVDACDQEQDRNQEPSDATADSPTVDDVLAELDMPGSGDRLEARREAVRACYQFLLNHGQAQKSDFLDDVYPDHTAGYQSSGGWWNTINPALRELCERRGDVDPPASEGEHTWEHENAD